MNKQYANDMAAGTPVHPGPVLADELEARGMKQKDLADRMGISAPMLSDLVHGRRNITAELALKLESVLGTPATFWVNLQGKHDLDKARKAAVAA